MLPYDLGKGHTPQPMTRYLSPLFALVVATACAGNQAREPSGAQGKTGFDPVPTPSAEAEGPKCLAEGLRLARYDLDAERSPCRKVSNAECVRLCEADDSAACVEVAYALEAAKDPGRDEAFARACRMQSHNGCTNYAAGLFRLSAKESDHACAYRLFELTCAAGEPFACGMQAFALNDGQGVAQDKAAAMTLATDSCRDLGSFSCSVFAKFAEAQGHHGEASAARRRACVTGDVAACQSNRP